MKNPFGDSSDFSDFMVMAPAAQASGDAGGGGGFSILGGPIDITDETREAEATFAASGDGGPGSVVAVGGAASAGLTINLIFDSAAMAAPQSFRDGITAAMQQICAVVTDKITINIDIDYSGTGGGAAAGPTGGNYVNYSTVRADLVNNASPGDTTFNSLPTGSTIGGQSSVAVWFSQEKLWGLLSPTGTEVDGSATFATDISPSLLIGVALHELTHAMGRVPYGSTPDVFDFYRYTSPGNYLFSSSSTAPAAYFSLNGGATKIADYGQTSDPSDFLNSGVQGSTDPFNEFYSGSTQQSLTAIDLMQLDALGFHLVGNTPTTTVIEAKGVTSLVQVGSNFFLDPVSGGTGPELQYQGSAVVAGTGPFVGWTPISAEATATGFEVAWYNASANLYTIWYTNTLDNFVSSPTGGVAGNSATLESFESSFQQDLNGDGIIGVPTSVIESHGATSLVQVGSNFFLDPAAGGTGPELQYQGSVVVAGTGPFVGWTPIGAEATSTGFEIAWHNAGASQYTIWYTDTHGNFVSSPTGGVAGNSATFESFESSFQQDLNGDGIVGIPTHLVQVGSNYFLNPVAGGTGPELQYQGSPVVAGAGGPFAGWTPIGAQSMATGFEVAWYNASDHIYTIWYTDTHGNFVSSPTGGVAGNSATFESFESSFQLDLNGDGVIGIPSSTTIESQGATSLGQVGSNFFLDPVAGGTGPELQYQGSPVVAGTGVFAGWTPIGAEATSTGFEIAWHNAGASLYTIWYTDTQGNFVSSPTGGMAGNSATFESFETSFHQDLNGDGVIGVPAHTSPAPQVASAAPPPPPPAFTGDDNFAFHPGLGSIGGGSAPPSAAFSPSVGDVLPPATPHIDVASQLVVADTHDVPATNDGPFDPLHGFIIH